jgi:sugar lactone lactonase YvrE
MTSVKEYGEPQVVIHARAEVGEGPVFDERTGRLVWVDITRGGLFETDLASGDQPAVTLPTMLGAAVPRMDAPGFAVAVSDGYGFIVDGELELVAPDLPSPDFRSNDAKCDSRGRLWAGTNHMEFVPGQGTLRVWDGGASSRVVHEGLTLPNGLGWNADDSEFYLVDSMTRRLLVASFDAERGEIGELGVLVAFDEEDGLPDGLAVDEDGGIWVAMWGGAQVLRVDRDGRVTGRIPMPCAQPSSCAFGADGTLYITSAASGLDEAQLAAQPDAGSVFALPTGTRGVPITSFAG